MQGGFSPLATLRNCSIVYLAIVIMATHTQREQLSLNETLSGSRLSEHEVRVKALLDFLLAQSTPPVTLWVCRRRLFAPRDSARPEIRCLG